MGGATRCTTLALALGLVLALLTGAGQAQAVPWFGFNDAAITRTTPPAGLLDMMRSTGADVHRVDATWRAIEREPGTFDWRKQDRMLRQLADAGMRPLIVLRSAPRWANDQAMVVCGFETSRPCELPPSSTHMQEWRRFVRLVAERYDEAVGFEIFNEPNFAWSNWRPAADAGAYVAVLRAAAEEIRKVRPTAPIISGGLLNLVEGRRPGDVAAPRFLQEMYAAGARGLMTAIGIHPYSTPIDARLPDSPYKRMLDDLRAVRAAAGDGATPFWITEMGYTVSTGPRGVTASEQAEFLPAAVGHAMRDPDVRSVIVHRFVDPEDDPANDESGFGVVRADLSPKPSFEPLRAAVAAVRAEARARKPRIRLRSAKGCVKATYLNLRVLAPAGQVLENVRFAVTGRTLRRLSPGGPVLRTRLKVPRNRRFSVRVSARSNDDGVARVVRRYRRCASQEL